MSIGIVGTGFVGKAVSHGFTCEQHMYDINDKNTSLYQMIETEPEAIFVCVPTPAGEHPTDSMSIVVSVVNQIKQHDYKGIIIIKSTVLPGTFDDTVVCNPEFLSRDTAFDDFINPPVLVLGGDSADAACILYKKYSRLSKDTPIITTNNNTACMIKYTMNCFYALKVCYMNIISEISEQCDANYNTLVEACKHQPWMGSHHFDVPGPDGKYGFGGPCLPKDIHTFNKMYDTKLLELVQTLNKSQRNKI